MKLDDTIEIRVVDSYSNYRLRPCQCGSDNLAYVKYAGADGPRWRVQCFDCGHIVDKGCEVQHDAQMAWNGCERPVRRKRG